GDVLITGPDSGEDLPLPTLAALKDSPAYRRNAETLTETYRDALTEESRILAEGDGPALGRFTSELPRVWRIPKSSRELRARAPIRESDLPTKRRNRFSEPACLFTVYYAGNYFGLKQAIEIDSVRLAIESLRLQTQISEWQAKALLAALFA